jgi:hypothetical protein
MARPGAERSSKSVGGLGLQRAGSTIDRAPARLRHKHIILADRQVGHDHVGRRLPAADARGRGSCG